MVLEALKLHVREKMRIGIVQMHHEPDRKQVLAEVIGEGPTAGACPEGPSHGVEHFTPPVPPRLQFPELLHSEAKFRRITTLI